MQLYVFMKPHVKEWLIDLAFEDHRTLKEQAAYCLEIGAQVAVREKAAAQTRAWNEVLADQEEVAHVQTD